MFTSNDFIHPSDLVCVETPNDTLDHRDFQHFDNHGFRLNAAEEAFYRANAFHVDAGFENSTLWGTNWIVQDGNASWDNFILGHCYTSYRCNYRGKAYDHILGYAEHLPAARTLLNIRPKWGMHFSLFGLQKNNTVFEIVRIRYDSNIYSQFNEVRKRIEEQILSLDWNEQADIIWQHSDEWKMLSGNKSLDWKAKKIFGWDKAEYIKTAFKI